MMINDGTLSKTILSLFNDSECKQHGEKSDTFIKETVGKNGRLKEPVGEKSSRRNLMLAGAQVGESINYY